MVIRLSAGSSMLQPRRRAIVANGRGQPEQRRTGGSDVKAVVCGPGGSRDARLREVAPTPRRHGNPSSNSRHFPVAGRRATKDASMVKPDEQFVRHGRDPLRQTASTRFGSAMETEPFHTFSFESTSSKTRRTPIAGT